MSAIRTRMSIIAMLLILAIVATGIWMMNANSGNTGPRTLNAELLNKNDGKDNCPTDGNAGTGNDNKGPNGGCRPPKGQYGKTN